MRSKVVFLLAILMGIITTAIFIYTMNEQQHVTVEEVEVPMAEVVVTVNSIKVNQVIQSEDVVLKSVPEESIHPSTVKSIEEVVGKFSTDYIEEGEVILQHRLKSSLEEQTLVSRKVTEGYRGVSVGVDIVRSVSNLIEPEDYVDIIFSYTEDDEETGEEERISELLLENVRVLAVGRKMITNPNGGDYAEYSSITLELTSDDVVALVNATENGSLHFAVRSRIVSEESE